MDTPENSASFTSWAIVSLFGHQKIIGLVTETKLAGGAFLKVDAPNDDGSAVKFTALYSPASIYSIQPVSKEIALELARHQNSDPISEWDVPKLTAEIKKKFVAGQQLALQSSQDSEESEEESNIVF